MLFVGMFTSLLDTYKPILNHFLNFSADVLHQLKSHVMLERNPEHLSVFLFFIYFFSLTSQRHSKAIFPRFLTVCYIKHNLMPPYFSALLQRGQPCHMINNRFSPKIEVVNHIEVNAYAYILTSINTRGRLDGLRGCI